MKRLLTVCMLLALVASAAFAGKEETKNVPVAKQQEILDMDKLVNLYHDGAELTEAEKAAVVEYLGVDYFDRGSEGDGLDNVGGPNAFGYRWVDNQAGDTATFSWIQLDGDPGATSLTTINNNDDAARPCTLSWSFPFYAGSYNIIRPATNGQIAFVTNNTSFSNACGGTFTSQTMPVLFAFWDDWHTGTGGLGGVSSVTDSGRVLFRDFGTHAVVQWDSVGRSGANRLNAVSFQAVLYRDGKIKVQWFQLDGTTAPSATVGIKDANSPGPLDYLQYICSTVADPTQAALAGRAVWFYVAAAAPGRCCYLQGGHGVCGDLLLVDCQALGGQFTPGVTCTASPCPVGRCCYNGGASCADVMQLECTFLGGTWDGTKTCTANPCPLSIPGGSDCATAVPAPVPSTITGTTVGGADNDPGTQCALGSADPYEGFNTAPDKWYLISGTGNTITVSTCAATGYDSQIAVYCGPCTGLNCVAGNDDAACSFSGVRSTASFCSQLGNTYYVVVDGWGSASGAYELSISDNGTPCTGAVNCSPLGRCCYTEVTGAPACADVTAAECEILGGEFNATATCESAPCYGSCCYIIHGEGFCNDESACADGITAAACATLSGVWTAGGSCAGQACPPAPRPCTCSCELYPYTHGIHAADATTYPILDVTVNDFVINVPAEYHITDINVAIDAIHTFDGDVEIRLTSPLGTTVILSDNRGSGGDNWLCTMFDDEAVNTVASGTAPFSGAWIPDQALSAFDGENAIGNWTLTFHDQVGGDFGYLIGACLMFEFDYILPVAFGSFDAVAGSERVTLNWNTMSETSVDFFEVTRDGAVIANVDAQNVATGATYTFVDAELTNGTSYTYGLTAVDVNGNRATLATQSATPSASAVITEYALHQNYPNPFNPTTNIAFDMVEAGNVSISIFNIMGQKVAEIVNGNMEAGRHVVTFDATGLGSGLYLYKMEANGFTAQSKMILMK